MGKNVFQGSRLIRLVCHGPCYMVVLVHDNLCVRSSWPFGWRVVRIEIVGSDGSLMVMSTYLHPSTGEGLADLDYTIRWAKGRSPRLLVGMDGDTHSPWWGPPSTHTNPVGDMIEDLILALHMEVVNHSDCPPTFVSDMGHTTWIDLTLGTQSRAFFVLKWILNTSFLISSDHHAIFF